MNMTDFENQAIPHEAGHIVVGLALGFPPIKGMAVIIFREPEGTLPGNFITRSMEPSDAAISITPPPMMAKYKVFVGGGLAGNIVSETGADNAALQDDRRKLSRVGAESLEEMAARGEPIIRQHMDGFLKLVEAIGDRYLALKNDLSHGTGEYLLLSDQELRDLSGINVPPMP